MSLCHEWQVTCIPYLCTLRVFLPGLDLILDKPSRSDSSNSSWEVLGFSVDCGLYGERSDVIDFIVSCDIGVLSWRTYDTSSLVAGYRYVPNVNVDVIACCDVPDMG